MENEKKTQTERVIEELETKGEVSNFWAIEHYILRLGAIIHSLRRDGWTFEGKFGKERGFDRPLWKNYYYVLTSRPQ